MSQEVIIKDDTIEEYHSKKEYFSSSDFEYLVKSPKTYKYFRDNPRPVSSGFTTGQSLHKLALERNQFEKHYTWIDNNQKPVKDADFRNAKNRKWKEKMENLALIEGKVLLSEEQFVNTLGMVNSLADNKYIMGLLSSGEIERSYYGYNEEFKLKVKLRPDFTRENNSSSAGGIVVDLKKTQDASLAFGNEIAKYNYHIRMPFILDNLNLFAGKEVYKTVWLIAVEEKPPYMCAIHQLDEDWLNLGRSLYRMYLNQLKEANETGIWKGYEMYSHAPNQTYLIPPIPGWLKPQYV